jgi:hypothetical protein
MLRQKLKGLLLVNPVTIERVLDTLLNFAFNEDVLALFKKLCRYYFTLLPIYSFADTWLKKYFSYNELHF